MTAHHDFPRRGSDCDRPRSVGEPDGAFDAALPILRELEGLVHAAVVADDVRTAGGAARDAQVAGVVEVGIGEDGPGDQPAHGGRSGEDAPLDHSDVASGPVPTTTLPSRSVRRSGTPASRTASAVDGAGCP